ncbi:E3 ubiquitin-protein ligase MARCHF8-like [Mercenaria mercenaria]|uniref:E3 ubiquitin-protein ligase MARCHF8-like n=1 Tax=Mercenaria mercenaria TaxID=6596 RepID=UPI00234E6B9F|nr:E3 ubiquitin-protein ligase MARCHF8-like [Mercenaria mercenaria]XP_045160187.2 E3 ubiquitin-protein ligase MARCHF8-like [Mercenaria mercenaria]XP_053393940.1 E3 ubiquitin-protein ligase MARCHF8-like [Mercenaria mercenaria]
MAENGVEAESLHNHCECESQQKSDSHHKLPRPPDDSDTKLPVDTDGDGTDFSLDDDSDDDIMDIRMKVSDSPSRLLLNGRPIVPHFGPIVCDVNDITAAGSSSISLPPQRVPMSAQQDLVWLGSSLGTMHKVPIRAKPSVGSRIDELTRSPSVLSKKMSSCHYSSLTVSSCGTDMYSFCKICQMQGDERDPLITPCRCSGTLRYIHVSCLKKWIRISQRRGKKQPPRCELCHFQYMRHKQFKFSQWRWPRVRPRDKCLHIIFLLNLLIMVGCAIATIMCFLSDRDNAAKFPKNKVKLTSEEIITLTCGVMFFVAFFIAMTVEIKARHTLYKLFLRFIMHNTEWTVESYDPSKDPLFKKAPLNVSQV